MVEVPLDTLMLLVAVAGLAGMIDAIAGGGGLLALPAILWAGLPPVQALATNKLQGSFGTLTASYNFIRRGEIDLRRLRIPILMTFIGSASGTLAVQRLGSDLLNQIVPALLIAFALYFLFSPRIGDQDAHHRISHGLFGLLIGFSLGFYDGFFGPGTGSFFAAAFVLLLGYNLRRATAGTKVLNFTSNIASLIFFALAGQVVWQVGLPMGLAQMAGAWIGSHLVIRHGTRLIRPLLVIVSLAISIKLLLSD
ncbi:MAG: TSUP family transporter [Gammaproteobacteria bacterium]|nr:TSUP family transporter [Gammaproteobacteria bacterium]MCP5431479.1 TSUP family transporter [Chromatiaceae bacterium]MCW5585762.1 TSUP family transporter [Chromatiales bacterium]HOP17466.1 TSUP family transporter [Gammaproteobacteria bacterium]